MILKKKLLKLKQSKNFNKLNIIFIGNPEIGHEVFYLIDKKKKFKISLFVTYQVSEKLKKLSLKRNFKILKVPKYNLKKYYKNIEKIKPDLIFEFGWSEILDERFLDLCPIIGQHPSLLPKRRGRAPITWAILDGLKFTGISMFYLDKKVDNGNIIYQKKIKITNKENSNSLLNKINHELYKLTLKYINQFPNNPCIIQNNKKATYTKKRTLKDSEIKLNFSLEKIDRFKRALVEPYYPLPFIKTKKGDIIQLDKITLYKKNDFFKKK